MTTDFPLLRRNLGLASGVLRDQFELGEIRETKLGEICPTARQRFPFYFRLPWDDPIKLLRWRIYVRKRCVRDLEFRAAIWKMCEVDIAFFAVTFAVIFEPRPFPRWLPFHLWTDQVSLLSWFAEIFGRRSGLVNKTRGIGLSWLTTLFIFHAWTFYKGVSIGVVTEDKDKLDSPGPNSLIGKFQYMFDHLPTWAKFTPDGKSKLYKLSEKTTFINVENSSVIQGFVPRTMKLRQLRFTMLFADEFAFYDRADQDEWVTAASGCTNCMLLVSTWNDFDDMFHYMRYEEESTLLKMDAFWWNNLERWRGAYKIVNGVVEYVDKEYKHTKGYRFGEPQIIDEGMIRSPWVDAELLQPGKNRSPLKALRDIYGKEVCQRTNSFFDLNILKMVKASVRPPDVQGILDVTGGVVKIYPSNKSNVRLWHGVPSRESGAYHVGDRGPYVIGCDLAHGVEGAYSTAECLDAGGRHVLEYGVNNVPLTEFAHHVVLLARMLAGENGDGWVTIDFEANGPLAKPFCAELLRVEYGAIAKTERKGNVQIKPGDVPTYYGTINRDGGYANFCEIARAVPGMELVIHAEQILADMGICSKDEDGRPKLPKMGKMGHGDFLQGLGVAWWRARTTISIESRVESTVVDARPDPRRAPAWEREKNTLWSSHWNKVA